MPFSLAITSGAWSGLTNHSSSTESFSAADAGLAAIDRAVHRANEAVSRAESIRKFEVLAEDFTEANGLLTPSLKVKRGAAEARYAEEIKNLYGE